MLDVQYRENVAVIDVRERIMKGEHPKREILDFIQDAKKGTIIEIHLPHRAEPLISALKSIGLSPTVTPVGPEHYRLLILKM